jgi:hypothetical protein
MLTLRLALPLYLLSLALGLIGALLALLGLSAFADRPWLSDLLGPNWLNTLVELGVSAFAAPPSDRAAVGVLGLEALLVTPLLVMVQWIGYTLFSGGILERLVSSILPGRPSTTFWADCRRWFWPFVWLGALGTFVFLVLAVIAVGMAAFASRAIGVTASEILLAAWVAILFGWLELARAAMVWRGSRSVGQALELATRLVIRPQVLLLWLFLALPSLGLFVVTLSAPSAGQSGWALTAVTAVCVGQVVAFLGAWLKVIRLTAASRVVAVFARQEASVEAA